MSVNKLSEDVQTLFWSSVSLTSYLRTIEELVYNSLDAKANSVAIRVNIKEKKIQVIDNGSGIYKKDFPLLGNRYATSKYVDISHLKSIPITYGFRGQSLASIVDVCKLLKVISRHENSEKTWMKTFSKGGEKDVIQITSRPSKGTTVDISGFLYNHKIQNKAVNEVQELYDIKSFLKKFALNHRNISISLRNDDNNEIVFEIHKKRDLYQTFNTLFEIQRDNVQELQVEKKCYKVVAYIGKDKDTSGQYHWIFVNKRFINNCRLHKMLKDLFTKNIQNKCKVSRIKSKRSTIFLDQEESKSCIPFYFIFLSCPYYDYDITHSLRQTIVEFKDWKEVNILLEKLIKFYFGDVQLKVCNKNKEQIKNVHDADIQEKVREIINKILNRKKLQVSQMKRGVKGNLTKRKKNNLLNKQILKSRRTILRTPNIGELKSDSKENPNPNLFENEEFLKSLNCDMSKLDTEFVDSIYERKKDKLGTKMVDNYKKKIRREVIDFNKKRKVFDPLISIFEKPSESIQRKCKIIEAEADNFIPNSFQTKTAHNISVIKTVSCRNMSRNNKNICIEKKFKELIIRDIRPLKRRGEGALSSHDLLNTVLGTQNCSEYTSKQQYQRSNHDVNAESSLTYLTNNNIKQTFESHQYNTRALLDNGPGKENNQYQKNNYANPVIENLKTNKPNNTSLFISKQARENFKNTRELAQNPSPTNFDISPVYSKLRNCNSIFKNNMTRNKINESYSYTIESIKSNFNDMWEKATQLSKINACKETRNCECLTNNGTKTVNCTVGLTFTITSSKTFMEPGNSSKSQLDNIQLEQNENVNNISSFSTNGVLTRVINKKIHEDDNVLSLQCFDHGTVKPNNIAESITRKEVKNDSGQSHDSHIIDCSIKNHTEVTLDQNPEDTPLKNQQDNDLKSQYFNYSYIEPNYVCETVLGQDIDHISCNVNDDCYNVDNNVLNPTNVNLNNNSVQNPTRQLENKHSGWILHANSQNNVQLITTDNGVKNGENNNENEENVPPSDFIVNKEPDKNHISMKTVDPANNDENTVEMTQCDNFINNTVKTFNINNRLRFLPKGISPIFNNCNTKSTCDNNLEVGYFENQLYNNFNTDVRAHTEVYEATVQNTKELTTRDVEKVNCRLNKDNASLTFNSESLQKAHILGQVDNKFIAALLEGASIQENYLVLFDQHAVHERISLELNLAEYFDGHVWKSVTLDKFTVKLTRDEIIFLHNYKNKFTRLGLQWTSENSNQINVHAIPAAILGLNCREVDKVTKAVKYLITEEIDNMKNQKGCASLYPKSIMDLVFNEACRYAIKFGDTLSKKQCMELIQSLSKCKTPFQCAHGRPVMAVMINIVPELRKYEVNVSNLMKIKVSGLNKYNTRL